MSDVVQISRLDKGTAVIAAPPVALPHTVSLPTRYYSRAAIEETARDFTGIAAVEARVGDGVIDLTFTFVDEEAGDAAAVIDEFLNHALYGSATAAEESSR